MKLAPSILSADLAHLALALEQCEEGGADLIHFDVMDGHFVPNLTFGIPVLAALRKRTRLPLDVHLMVEAPDRLLGSYLEAGADRVAVHWEVTSHLDSTLRRIREGGAQAGVALNPATPVECLQDVLAHLDFVVMMSVNPGFSGQSFLPHVLNKTRRLKEMLEAQGAEVEIEMDGGLGRGTIRSAVEAGVETCVAGSAVFATADPVVAMTSLRRLASGEIE